MRQELRRRGCLPVYGRWHQGFVTRLAVPARNARSAELRTRIRCKRGGGANEDENAHQNEECPRGVSRQSVRFPQGVQSRTESVANVQRIRPSEPAAGLWCSHPLSQFLRCKSTQ